ncbi:MAG: hypothetical protein BWK79_01715 [Beggiatoa sp. IS2]|nr:MAG: hypothetical protein BWK79_01715 [Beggiatoa sp. IS2]
MTDKKSEDKFSARATVLAYLHQVKYALYLILRAENEDESIFIEKLDDIDFDNDRLVQIKYHLKEVSLSDGSDDLWKTIRVWSEHLTNGLISLNENLVLTLITTAKAPEGKIATLLRDDTKRNPDKACKKLVKFAEDHKLKTAFEEFQKLTSTQQLELVKRIKIIDDSPNISEIQIKIKNEFHGIHLDYREAIFERLIGWWEKQVIEHLQNGSEIPIKKYDVEQRLSTIAGEYNKSDSLPLNHIDAKCPIGDIENDNRRFVTHLKKIIDLKKDRRILEQAIAYFYRADLERTNWLSTKGLIKMFDNNQNEITRYEERLKNKWEEQVQDVRNSSDDDFGELDDKQKKKAGWNIFSKTRSLNIRIRERVEQEYIMQGNYHILTNEDKVAWHPDEILKILTTEEN